MVWLYSRLRCICFLGFDVHTFVCFLLVLIVGCWVVIFVGWLVGSIGFPYVVVFAR